MLLICLLILLSCTSQPRKLDHLLYEPVIYKVFPVKSKAEAASLMVSRHQFLVDAYDSTSCLASVTLREPQIEENPITPSSEIILDHYGNVADCGFMSNRAYRISKFCRGVEVIELTSLNTPFQIEVNPCDF